MKITLDIKFRIRVALIIVFCVCLLSLSINNLTGYIIGSIINLFVPFIILTNLYLTTREKFLLSLICGIMWAVFSYSLAYNWMIDFGSIVGIWTSTIVIFGIAVIPGFMNAFMVASLWLDRRPPRKPKHERYPAITILIAAYNEENNILSTLESIDRQDYPGDMTTIVINDGSKDNTALKVQEVLNQYPWLMLVNFIENKGKSAALNKGLHFVETNLTITIDADSYLYRDALKHLVERYMGDPKNTAAVAGAVLVRNSRKNFVTKVQEWDYFHGIASIKRIQSLYQGTLVAQGAFSLYETKVLRELNKWPACVGEDIVLTWSILNRGYRVGFAEDACLFTNAPDTWPQFIRQRQRWSRGLVEAFKLNWSLLFKPRMTTLFIWWNLLFFYLDIVYTIFFIPGLILALFGIYWIAGPMTLIVLPLAMMVNYVMYGIQTEMFTRQGLRVRKNIFGFIFYALFYSLVLQPACVVGYLKELLISKKKSWGTK